MESLKVTPSDLENRARQIDEKAGEYAAEYRKFFSEMEDFTSRDWTGQGAKAFMDRLKGFEDDFNKMKQLMNDYAAFLRNAANTYDSKEDEIIQRVSSLQN
ncbi:MAG: WXG100 family type VII secretion target [Hungatella sp.]|jgi:WXG100 family type VII secretion target|nr:WXG100 family type VII secretion target [Hungatella sp.]